MRYSETFDDVAAIITTLYILEEAGGLKELQEKLKDSYTLKIKHSISPGKIKLVAAAN